MNVFATSKNSQDVRADQQCLASYPINPLSWQTKTLPKIYAGVEVIKLKNEIVLTFTKNTDFNYHHTFVKHSINPSHKYRLTGKIRAENLTSATGACLEIQDIRGFKKLDGIDLHIEFSVRQIGILLSWTFSPCTMLR